MHIYIKLKLVAFNVSFLQFDKSIKAKHGIEINFDSLDYSNFC